MDGGFQKWLRIPKKQRKYLGVGYKNNGMILKKRLNIRKNVLTVRYARARE